MPTLTRPKTDAARGRIQPGPVPASLAAVLDTYATLNREFPASPTWQLQANLANEVLSLASSVSWPDRITEPKPPQNWAIEIAMPVVKSGDAAAAKTCVAVLTTVINDCAALKQRSARGLATRIHAQLLALIEPSHETWPAEMLRHVDLLAAALRYCREQTEPKRVVAFACDTGNKYLSKLYNDFWLEDQGFIQREQAGDLRDLIGRPHGEHATITVGPSDVLTTAHNRLRNAGFSQLPVMDEGELVGIVTATDILLEFARIVSNMD